MIVIDLLVGKFQLEEGYPPSPLYFPDVMKTSA